MSRLVALAFCATILSACSDNAPTVVASAPMPDVAPPAVEAPPVALPPLPSVTASDAAADPAAPEAPTPVEKGAATAVDSPATDPKGTLTKEEETKSMPEALHGNNHSSTALDSSPQK